MRLVTFGNPLQQRRAGAIAGDGIVDLKKCWAAQVAGRAAQRLSFRTGEAQGLARGVQARVAALEQQPEIGRNLRVGNSVGCDALRNRRMERK